MSVNKATYKFSFDGGQSWKDSKLRLEFEVIDKKKYRMIKIK